MLEKLSAGLIENIIDTMPVEISFADSQDVLLYYNHGDKRFFRIPPDAIGRKIQQCHPEKSRDKVQQLLDDLKSGKRDSAEFWIDYKDRLLYIRYFAVRDSDGKYQGTLEITQDITEIKDIEGEKRLLD